MRQESPLPPQWACLAGRVRFVQKHSAVEYSCTCPKCGGDIHADGSWPDRCRLFLDNSPRLWCRRCGLVAFASSFERNSTFGRPSPEQLEKWRQKQIIKEEARKRSAERALAHLRDEKLWERYFNEAGEVGRSYWLKRGIPQAWQDWWKLGWCADYTAWRDGAEYHTASATIPIFDPHWQLLNVKHRLLRPPHDTDKYRYELTGQGANALFLADPEANLAGPIVAIEGEIKAAVVKATLDDMTTIVGLPGMTPGPAIIKTLSEAESVILVLDPGGAAQARKLAGEIGRGKTKVWIPAAGKVDDNILEMGATKYDVQRWLSMAEWV
jgi:hypothetical protein